VCEKISEKRLFIATCPTIDSEMNERVIRHREERKGRGWQTKECPLQLETVFEDETADFEVVLLDCVTLWVNNVLFSVGNDHDGLDDHLIKEKTIAWLSAAEKVKGTVVCVTNEVGLGIVPDNPLARIYRVLVGTVNHTFCKMADEVILVSCGVPLYLKKIA
jgi:adenosylcobinamide kinase/adenosylcobinamide-phosphate guanylyltransferase